MKLIDRLFGRKPTLNGVSIERAMPSTPVIRYVNLILYQMFQEEKERRILRQSETLPIISEFGDDLQPPSLEAVVNRLKVMAGLNPVKYTDPTDGSLQVWIGGHECRVLCRFDDGADSRCEIRMEKMETAQP
jgi:hypothetical protein